MVTPSRNGLYARVLALLAEGVSREEVAARLGITRRKVRRAVSNAQSRDNLRAMRAANGPVQAAEDRDAKLRQLVAEGLTRREICVAMDWSESNMHYHTRRLGLTVARSAYTRTVKSQPPPSKFGRGETPLQSRMRQLVADGLSITQIADAMGIENTYVASVCVKLGLQPVRAVSLRQPVTTKRKCLGGCGALFDSTGPGHRICSSCKSGADWHDTPSNYVGVSLG